MSLKIQSTRISTTLTPRPTLLRVWRTDGTHLTSAWLPALAPNPNAEGGPRL